MIASARAALVAMAISLGLGVSTPLAGCATVRAEAPPPPRPVKRPVAVREPAPEPEPAPAQPLPVEPEPAPVVPEVPAEQGMASYYADSLTGHRTANGERYRPELATCAHRTLPFGTALEVTAVASGKTSACRVNDRGPWVKGRILDVSKKVARELGMIGPGLLEVRVRPAPPAE